jgi:hypothetical protein
LTFPFPLVPVPRPSGNLKKAHIVRRDEKKKKRNGYLVSTRPYKNGKIDKK